MSDEPTLTLMPDEELRELVDRAFLKHTGKTWRTDGKDSLMQIEHDYPSIFGGQKADP
jgi:hypothetical protein